MSRYLYAACALLLLILPDTRHSSSFRPLSQEPGQAQISSGLTLRDLVFAATQKTSRNSRLTPASRLEIVRYVSGEFVKVQKPLPAYKKGFHFAARSSLDEKELQKVLATHGTAVPAGQTAQITRIDFREKEIVVDVNGGAKKKGRWLDHFQIGLGGPTIGPQATSAPPAGPRKPPGATLILEYGGPVPDMGPEDLKHDLSPFLDFSKKSAALQWVDTLPPLYQKAIKDRRAVVGMDHDMVIAALGRPDQKVRERTEQGEETEDWIYGTPPARTIFVTFVGDKVVRVKQYP